MKINKFKCLLIIFSIVFLVQVGAISPNSQGNKAYGKDSPTESIPQLLITEVVAQSTTLNGSDAYEFVEIYNATNQETNLNDYAIHYRYPENVDDLIWPISGDLTIQPESTFVLWVGKSQNEDLTVQDFNDNYNTELEQGKDIIKIDAHSMINDRQRTMVIATKSGHEVVTADYNNASYDVEPNKGIFYKYPEDGSNQMALLNSATDPATPGSVETDQIPDQTIPAQPDASPQIENLTEKINSQPEKGLDIVASSKDGRVIKTFTLYFKIDDEENYTKVPLTFKEEDSLYHFRIDDLFKVLASSTIKYYFVASNGSYTKKSDSFEMQIERERGPLLNTKDEQFVSGKTLIKGSANGEKSDELALSVDDNIVDAYPTLGESAYFVFNGTKMNKGYQNAVTKGKDILFLMDEAPSGKLTVPVTEGLTDGKNEIAIRSGDYHKTYFEDDPPEGKLNTFIVKNFRLLLGDGTVLKDPDYDDAEKEYHIGDAASNPSYMPFSFDIPKKKMDAVAYEWDTAEELDGEHVIQVETADGELAKSTVIIDNEKPTIESTLVDGKHYKGNFTIDAKITDDISGVKNSKVKLDGEQIDIPYETSSAELHAGDHSLQITAEDNAKNISEESVEFTVVAENPGKPKVISPVNGSTDVSKSPNLKVLVTDPTNDDLDVTFFQGYKYNADKKENISAFKGETSTAPAQKRVPDGDKELTETEYKKILESDEEMLSTTSDKFPYLRMEIDIDQKLDDNDTVQLNWEGQSLEGRKIALMAWNHHEGAWNVIDETHSDKGESSTLTGNVPVVDYVKHNKIDFMVQDQDFVDIAQQPQLSSSNYDYTFAWITDTQFNVESDPRIFKSQIDWIKNNVNEKSIEYVFHTGDIVNRTFEEKQWELADQYMGVLDNNDIPYGVLAGNHDIGQGYILDFDYSYFYKYFGEDRFDGKPYFGNSYKNNRGHYDLITVNGNDYIMVYMGWGDGDLNPNWLNEDIEWMNDVLAAYPNRKAILNFHKYVHSNGQLEPANADQIFEEVVVPNENVAMVLSGHYTGSELLTSEIDDNGDGTPDRKVYQILSNYQGTAEGGAGYMKLLNFNTLDDKVYMETYSPYMDDFDPENKLPGTGEFILDLESVPEEKQVATDHVEINIFNNEKIGIDHVESGEHAEVEWNDLASDQTYYWYVTAKDNYGGHVMSDLQQFTTETSTNAIAIKELVNQFEKDGKFKDEQAAQALKNHLTAVAQFEEKEVAEKVVKHMTGFKQLLDHQIDNSLVSDKAYHTLNLKADLLIKKWEQ